jgi:predicted pyridoxine 5'-phosphate oxidase superfamily flavin-nucleotide-binding protein
MNEITEPVINLLEGKNFAFFSTLMKDGSPQITPVWIDWDKNTNTILINTAKGRLKQEGIRG